MSHSNQRGSKMLRYINWRLRVRLSDHRSLVGTFLAFDRHMNIVLADTDEFVIIKEKKKKADKKDKENKENNENKAVENQAQQPAEREIKRSLGLVLIRGCNVISLYAESKPQPKPKNIILNPNNAPAQKLPGAVQNIASAGRGQAISINNPIIAAHPQPNMNQPSNMPPTNIKPPPTAIPPQYAPNLPPHMMGRGIGPPPNLAASNYPGQYGRGRAMPPNLPPHLQQPPPHMQQYGRGQPPPGPYGRGG
jgi:small nuclear ribonucleoprotein B and B'